MKLYITILLALATQAAQSGQLLANCSGCTKTYSSADGRTTTLRRCSLKQKWIEGDRCPRCACPRRLHSAHKHPYKIYTDAEGTTYKLQEKKLPPIKIG